MPPVGLHDLDVGLLVLIFEFVHDTCPRSTQSLAAVNRIFRATAKLVSYRYQTITFGSSSQKANEALTEWLQDQQAIRGIRHLEVVPSMKCGPKWDESVQERWGTLVSLIQRLGNLKSLSWHCFEQVPLAIIQALEKFHRRAELRVYTWQRREMSTDHTDAAEIALARSPALTVLKASIWTGGYIGIDLRVPAFQRVVANAPNLKQVHLSTGHSGCVIGGHYCPTQMAEKFCSHVQPNRAITKLSLSLYQIDEHTLQEWSVFMDLSRLEYFQGEHSLVTESFLRSAILRLDHLKHVKLKLGSQPSVELSNAMCDYLAICAPLTTLGLQSWGSVPLPSILDRHGATLETLILRDDEKSTLTPAVSPRRILSVSELETIRVQCPCLMDLTIDLNRKAVKLDSNDHRDAFEILSKMKLDRLQLYYDLGRGHFEYITRSYHPMQGVDPEEVGKRSGHLPPSDDEFIEPYVEEVWERVFGHVRTGERALDVKFGDWEARSSRGLMVLLPGSRMEKEKRSFWKVRRDDWSGRGRAAKVTRRE